VLASAVRRNLFAARQLALWHVATLVLLTVPTQAQEALQATHDLESSNITKISDVLYAQVDGHELKLDIYMPASVKDAPLLVYIHGGAWRRGSKDELPTEAFIENGFAVASVEFRMSSVAMFPAQIHDIKAALRYLRGNASEYGFDASKIGIYGTSSGGHLVSMVAVSNGDAMMEGSLGNYLNESSDVQAVVSYYGASNLTSILDQSTPHGLRVRGPALDLLIGGQPEDQKELALLASPVFHVDASSAPMLMLHGDQDPQMPINQSHELHHAYQRHGVEVQFEVVHGAAHGGPLFVTDINNAIVKEFFDRHLL
jgi:acetyl esterase/lipase